MQIPKSPVMAETALKQPARTAKGTAEAEDSAFLNMLRCFIGAVFDPEEDTATPEYGMPKEEKEQNPSDLYTAWNGAILSGCFISVIPEGSREMNICDAAAKTPEECKSSPLNFTDTKAEEIDIAKNSLKNMPWDFKECSAIPNDVQAKDTPQVPAEDAKTLYKSAEAEFLTGLPPEKKVSSEQDGKTGHNVDEGKAAVMDFKTRLVHEKGIEKGVVSVRDGLKNRVPESENPEKTGYIQGCNKAGLMATETGRSFNGEGPQPLKTATKIDIPDIAEQVAERIKVMAGQRKTQISIQLKPESLGRLKVSLTVTDGVLNGRIIVQNDNAKALIQTNIMKLQENLEQQGIPVGKLNVNLGGGYNHHQFFGENRQPQHKEQDTNPYREEKEIHYMFLSGEGTIELLA